MAVSDILWQAQRDINEFTTACPDTYDADIMRRIDRLLRDMATLQHELDTPPGTMR